MVDDIYNAMNDKNGMKIYHAEMRIMTLLISKPQYELKTIMHMYKWKDNRYILRHT